MANAVEKQFDLILPNLEKSNPPQWPDLEDHFDPDELEDSLPDGDAGLFTVDEEQLVSAAPDSLAGRRVTGELSDDEKETIEGGVRFRGMDVLAFYKSRRRITDRPFPGRWGIFYLKQGLVFLESEISREYPGFGDPRELALEFLRAHERFHFRADLQTLMLEAVLGRELYSPLRQLLRGRQHLFAEEALANRQVWDWARRGSIGIRDFAFDFMKLQPGAYARFDENRLQLAGEWAASAVDLAMPGIGVRPDLAHWVETSPEGLLRRSLCAEYVVYPTKLSHWISPALVLPNVKDIAEDPELVKSLERRFQSMRVAWERTKAKLLENRLLRGLNFKPWPPEGKDAYSVRVNDSFRAHLRNIGEGRWLAYKFGPHPSMGHG